MNFEKNRLLTIVSKDFDDLEFFYPMIRLREQGASVVIASETAKETIKGKYGLSTTSDIAFSDVSIEEYDGILIPGGWAPDYLRRLAPVLDFVKYMDENNRLIGIICHAGWVLSSADILKGRRVTSTPGIKHDLIHAGAIWTDEPAVVDGNLVSGRRPPDLHLYLPKIIEVLDSQNKKQ